MTITEALKILKPFRDCMFDQHGCPISDAAIALDVIIDAVECDLLNREDVESVINIYFNKNNIEDGDWYCNELINEITYTPSAAGR